MSVQGEDKDAEGPAESASEEHRAAGLTDFTQYSAGQLKELQFSIDSRSFPRNFNNLLAELAKREQENDGQAAPARTIYLRRLPAAGSASAAVFRRSSGSVRSSSAANT
jgi:hypothetical protein